MKKRTTLAAAIVCSFAGAASANLLDDITGAIWGDYAVVPIPGAYCGDGSQYKIFVDRANSLLDYLVGNNRRLTVYLEPGGACWDYESCTGQTGIRGAANPNGIPDNHMNVGAFLDPNVAGGSVNAIISPVILKNHPSGKNVKTSSWNKVFVPYCTGDVYSGNQVTTYTDPNDASKSISYRHVGAKNMELVVNWLKANFNAPKEMLVSGCSAGGAGSLINYHFIRKALNPAKSYLLNDSGPIFPYNSNQKQLQDKIRGVWNLDYILSKYQTEFPNEFPDLLNVDFGQLNTALADRWPNDQLAITLFKRDGNYSAYSYARFFGLDESDPAQKEQTSVLWNQDVQKMIAQYNTRSNLSYYIPYYRNVNESHCTTIVEWTGSEIQTDNVNVGHFINDLMDGGAVTRREEAPNNYDKDVSSVWLDLVNALPH